MIALALAAAATGATYLFAKKKKLKDGTSVAISAATGVATYALWWLFLIGGAAIYLGSKYAERQKALGPGS